MFGSRFKFVVAILLLAVGFTFSGCIKDSSSENESGQTAASIDEGANTEEQIATSSLSGKVTLDETPTDQRTMMSASRRFRSLNSESVFQITAYNLTDKTEYQTTSANGGDYALTGLTAGEYQIVAENSALAKSTSRNVYLARGTKATIDIVLQAAGSISGTAIGAFIVSIPGTDHVGTVASDGSFKLTGVPVGTVTLRFDADEASIYQTFTLAAGENFLDQVVNLYEFGLRYWHVPQSGTVGVMFDGIYLSFTQPVSVTDLMANMTLKNAAGETVPFNLDLPRDDDSEEDKEMVSSEWNLFPDAFLEEGTYTLTMWDKPISIFIPAAIITALGQDDEGGNTNRFVMYFFPQPLTAAQIEDATNDITVTDDSGGEVTNVSVRNQDGILLAIVGDFRVGVDYTVGLPASFDTLLAGKDIFRYGGFDDEQGVPISSADAHIFHFPAPNIRRLSPANGSQGVGLDDRIAVEFGGTFDIDTGSISIEVTVDEVTTTYDKDQLIVNGTGGSRCYWDWDNDSQKDMWECEIPSFLHSVVLPIELQFGKTYEVMVSAFDDTGAQMMGGTTFSTIVPGIEHFSPDFMLSGGDSEGDFFRAEFNVPMLPYYGSAVIENSSGTVDALCSWGRWGRDGFEGTDMTQYACVPSELLPDTEYTVTLSGFRASDGTTEVADSVYTYKTSSQMLFVATDAVANGAVDVDPAKLNHTVSFYVFGKMTADQVTDFKAKLKVRSFGANLSADQYQINTLDLRSGTLITVSFTIDYGTSYEVLLWDGTGYSYLDGIITPASLLSFTTMPAEPKIPGGVVFDRLVNDFNMEYRVETGPSGLLDGLVKGFSGRLWVPMEYLADGYINYPGENQSPPLQCSDNVSPFTTTMVKMMLSIKQGSQPGEGTGIGSDKYVVNLNKSSADPVWIPATPYYSSWSNYSGPVQWWCMADVEFSGMMEVDYGTHQTATLTVPKVWYSSQANVVSNRAVAIGQTDPIGSFELYVWDGDSGGQPEDLKVVFQSQSPFNAMDVAEYLASNGLGGNVAVMDIMHDPSTEIDVSSDLYASRLVLSLKRPAFSVLPCTIFSGGATFDFFNLDTGTVESVALKGKTGLLEVVPDLTPMTVSKVTTDQTGDVVIVEFARLADPEDFLDATSDIAQLPCQIVDDTGTPITLSGVELILTGEWATGVVGVDSIRISLPAALDENNVYKLELLKGEVIHAMAGVQTLEAPFSRYVQVAYGDFAAVGEWVEASNNSLALNSIHVFNDENAGNGGEMRFVVSDTPVYDISADVTVLKLETTSNVDFWADLLLKLIPKNGFGPADSEGEIQVYSTIRSSNDGINFGGDLGLIGWASLDYGPDLMFFPTTGDMAYQSVGFGATVRLGIRYDSASNSYIVSADGYSNTFPMFDGFDPTNYIADALIQTYIRAEEDMTQIGDGGAITAAFDDVYVNGVLHDDFEASTDIDQTKWSPYYQLRPDETRQGLIPAGAPYGAYQFIGPASGWVTISVDNYTSPLLVLVVNAGDWSSIVEPFYAVASSKTIELTAGESYWLMPALTYGSSSEDTNFDITISEGSASPPPADGSLSNPLEVTSEFVNTDAFTGAGTRYYKYLALSSDINITVEIGSLGSIQVNYFGADSKFETTPLDQGSTSSPSTSVSVGQGGISPSMYYYFSITAGQAGSTDITVANTY
ncbi:MAG: hypothetical protein GY866_01395 [Proteobacteria bacterium]|nr:hypothetical protein [Pseudomonadota bacterium]